MDLTKMTTSQMIEFLQAYEHGGASGRPRDITFWVNGKPYDLVGLRSTGDGLVTNIGIQLENSDRLKKRHDDEVRDELARQLRNERGTDEQ